MFTFTETITTSNIIPISGENLPRRPYIPSFSKYHVMASASNENMKPLLFETQEKCQKFIEKQISMRHAQGIICEYEIIEIQEN